MTNGNPEYGSTAIAGMDGVYSPGAFGAQLPLRANARASEVVFVSAANVRGLAEGVDALLRLADRIRPAELTDLAAALARGPHTGGCRLAVLARSPRQLAESLERVSRALHAGGHLSEVDDGRSVFAGRAREAPTCVGLFPGQGCERPDMGEHLVGHFPFLRVLCRRAGRAVEDLVPHPPLVLRGLDSPDAGQLAARRDELRDTRIAQPAIALASVVTFAALRFVGLEPDLLIGHGLGEIGALQGAGACDPATAIRIAAMRGRAMAALDVEDSGSMAVVAAGPDTVEKLLDRLASPLVISSFDSNRQTVVSGSREAIRYLERLCQEEEIHCRELSVSHAFHSPSAAPAARAFLADLGKVTLRTVGRCVVSTSTGREVAAHADLRRLLGDQIAKPVRFLDAVLEATTIKPDLWIEVGPGNALTRLVRDILGENGPPCLPTDLPGRDGLELLNRLAARAHVLGFPLVRERLASHRRQREVPREGLELRIAADPRRRTAGASEVAGGEFPRLLEELRLGLEELRARSAGDPLARGTERRHVQFAALLDGVVERLVRLGRRVAPEERRGLRQTVQRQLLAFLDGSEVFRHSLTKPLGHPGDFLLLDKLGRLGTGGHGLAYHFDRYQLDHAAFEACRGRVRWVHGALAERLERALEHPLAILDLGVGAAASERRLVQTHPRGRIELAAVDREPAALEFVQRRLGEAGRGVETHCFDLADASRMGTIAALAHRAQVCIAVGILEALPDADAEQLLATVLRALPTGGALYTDCLLPGQKSRGVMEWYLDLDVASRSEADLVALAERAGAPPEQIRLDHDATASLALLEVST